MWARIARKRVYAHQRRRSDQYMPRMSNRRAQREQSGPTRPNEGGGNNRPFSDPDFDGREPREVLLLMGRARRWLESRGFTIQLSGEYRKVEIKKVKFE